MTLRELLLKAIPEQWNSTRRNLGSPACTAAAWLNYALFSSHPQTPALPVEEGRISPSSLRQRTTHSCERSSRKQKRPPSCSPSHLSTGSSCGLSLARAKSVKPVCALTASNAPLKKPQISACVVPEGHDDITTLPKLTQLYPQAFMVQKKRNEIDIIIIWNIYYTHAYTCVIFLIRNVYLRAAGHSPVATKCKGNSP